MCGIHGVAALSSDLKYEPHHVKAMGDVSAHRGPDDSGIHVEDRVIIGMRRLSIIDVVGGHQPISNADNSIWVVCNGEIYNFLSLREELLAQGFQFKTKSDTEVLLHLYQRDGLEFVNKIEGMYGFAIWDNKRQRLVVGRDRLGIKPLYYSVNQGNLVFASELKSILELPGFSAQIDPAALSEYLMVGYVPAPHAMIDGVKKLPAGTMLVCENGELRDVQYWKVPTELQQMSAQEWKDKFLEELDSAVSSQMVSDVPLGAFLSGGIDSSAVVACMAAHSSQPVKTFSIGFGAASGGQYYNELPYARQVSELFATDHKEIIVEPQVVDLMPKLLWHMDEPIADTAFVTTYLVSEFARREVTVILSGVGGDELFGGYRRYLGEYYMRAVKWIPPALRRGLLKHVVNRLPADRHSPLMNLSRYAKAFLESSELSFEQRYMGYVSVMGREQLNNILNQPILPEKSALELAFAEFSDGNNTDVINSMMQVDMVSQLPDDLLMLTDKMSMAASLECRVPLLGERLVNLGMTMPSSEKIRGRELKSIMKRSLEKILPKEILYRKKRGFGAPMGAWFKHELKPLLEYLLSSQSINARGLFKDTEVRAMIDEHQRNKADRTDELMSLLNLELWARMYIDGRSHDDVNTELKGVV